MNSYEYWESKKKTIQRKMDELPLEDYSKDLNQNYQRQIEIFDDIFAEARMVFDDDQYTETTSWSYEDELKNLQKQQEELEEIFEEIYPKMEHQKLLNDLGWTEEQYNQHQKEVKNIKKRRKVK